jgi:hypothetical protein
MDFRIQETVDRLLASLGDKNGDFDRVSIAGGAGNFGELVKHLQLSTSLHNAQNLILTVHEDCGAGATREDLVKALKIARELYPDRRIQGFYIYLRGEWEEISAGKKKGS